MNRGGHPAPLAPRRGRGNTGMRTPTARNDGAFGQIEQWVQWRDRRRATCKRAPTGRPRSPSPTVAGERVGGGEGDLRRHRIPVAHKFVRVDRTGTAAIAMTSTAGYINGDWIGR